MALTYKDISAIAKAVVEKFASDEGLRQIISYHMSQFNGGHKAMSLAPDDIEAIADAVVRKFTHGEGFRRMFREEALNLLNSNPSQAASHNPLLMDDQQLRYAESLLATDEERRILRIRAMAARMEARGQHKSAQLQLKFADRLERKFWESQNNPRR